MQIQFNSRRPSPFHRLIEIARQSTSAMGGRMALTGLVLACAPIASAQHTENPKPASPAVHLSEAAAVYLPKEPESNFQRVALPDGASLELPKSWKFSTDANGVMDEGMEAAASGIAPQIRNFNPAQNKTQIVAVGRLGDHKCSMAVIYIDAVTATQAALEGATPEQKLEISKELERVMAATANTQVKISIEKIGKYQTIVSQTVDKPGERPMRVYQIPFGTRIVQMQFIYDSKLKAVWEPIWIKMVGSYFSQDQSARLNKPDARKGE